MSQDAILTELEKLAAELRGRVSHLRTIPNTRELNIDAYDICADRLTRVVAAARGMLVEGKIARDVSKVSAGEASGAELKIPTRKITDHQINPLNDAIEVVAIGAPGPGGANNHYEVRLPKAATDDDDPRNAGRVTVLNFQRGALNQIGVNGMTTETLIAIAIDRMRGFQFGRAADGTIIEGSRPPCACRDNAIVLTHLEDALLRLQNRSRDRSRRGVEGQQVA